MDDVLEPNSVLRKINFELFLGVILCTARMLT